MAAPLRRVQTGAAGAGLEPGAKHHIRSSLRRRQSRAAARTCRRACWRKCRRDRHECGAADRGCPQSNQHHPHRHGVGRQCAGGRLHLSLARPGGNVTGLTLVATEQSAKRLQLLKEMVPNLVRVAVGWNRHASGHHLQLREMELVAPGLGLTLQSLPLCSADDLDAALQAAARANAQALFTMDDPLVLSQRARIVELAMRRRLPVMGEFRSVPEAGGLVSYGPNQLDMWRRAALYVDKIFRGAKPADLPVEQPTKFELVINLKTATALGLTLAPGVLAIADEVIECWGGWPPCGIDG